MTQDDFFSSTELVSNKDLLQTIFQEVFESPTYDEQILRKYFSPEYTMSVDGKTLDFDRFLQHIQVQKKAVRSMSIHVKTLVEQGDIVFSNHIAKGETIEGRRGEIQVIAEFRFREGKIVRCDVLTHLLTGDPRDRDLGSRH